MDRKADALQTAPHGRLRPRERPTWRHARYPLSGEVRHGKDTVSPMDRPRRSTKFRSLSIRSRSALAPADGAR